MEYVQERITTLHDLTDPCPAAPTDRAAVVVPMTDREYADLAAERTLSALAAVDPERVIVPLRVPPERVEPFREWLEGFDLPVEVLWCNAPRVEALLSDAGLDGEAGKGRDVWLALGLAAEAAEYVALVDADSTTFSGAHLHRLLAPFEEPGFSFSKGYYARVENDRLYGRLFRLFFVPVVRALADAHDAPVLAYLDAFRYALAGEFAATADLTRRFRVQRGWGLEVGTLGDAFEHADVRGTAQVDLGRHEHDHRSVSGPTGLSEMSREVGAALLRVVEEGGVTPDYATLPDRYRRAAERLIDGYAADARFNGLEYDRAAEREQVEAYAGAVAPPGEDRRLPAWRDAPLDPAAVRRASRRAVDEGAGSEEYGTTRSAAGDPEGES
ncbi:glycosyl transferase family 2 [Halobacteriales archaeon QS_8_69_26]|nr:MAG: glycosyl transferase family 2 [Halobacteriales archaeon QS_8_69_26]